MEEQKSSQGETNESQTLSQEEKDIKRNSSEKYRCESIERDMRNSSDGSSKRVKQGDICEKEAKPEKLNLMNCVSMSRDTGLHIQDNVQEKEREPCVCESIDKREKGKDDGFHSQARPSSVPQVDGINDCSTASKQKENTLSKPAFEKKQQQPLSSQKDAVGETLQKESADLNSGDDMAASKELCTDSQKTENTQQCNDSTLIAEQQLGLKQAEQRLERDYIFRMEKRSQEYPNCQYLCKLCSVHIENIQGAHKHIKEKRHKKNILEKQEENELRGLPGPSATHLAALSVAVNETAKQQGISEADFQVRQEIVNQMEKIIQLKLPECTLRIYGSSLTRFGFNTSDINIDVCFPSMLSQPDVLIQVLETLKNCSSYEDVESDFHTKVPVVFCKHVERNWVLPVRHTSYLSTILC